MATVHLGDQAAPLRILIHTPEAGDPYYIGDCYERSSVPSEWEVNVTDMPYLSHIKALSNSWKPLLYLADFMEVGTAPLRWKDLKLLPKERAERVRRTNVTYLKCPALGATSTLRLQDTDSLKELISDLTTERGKEDITHILVVEDLSRDVIEVLGAAFDIDPFFFREHIDEYSWYNTRDPWAIPPSLIASIEYRSWFRMRNARLHYFESEVIFQQARQESTMFNILRRPDNDDNHWKYLDKPGSVVSLTRTKTSVWTGKTGFDKNVTVGIVLVDPTISGGHPLWHGQTNWLPTPSMQLSGPDPTPRGTNVYEQIVHKTSTYPWFSRNRTERRCSKAIIANPALYTVAAEWLILCDYMKARLGQIEWELGEPKRFRAKDDTIDASLKRLHVWRRVIPNYREMVAETLDQALPAAAQLLSASASSTGSGGSKNEFGGIEMDFQRIQNALNELQARVDRLTSIVTSEIVIEDSRRGLQENKNLARLTWLATTFIPLSFVTGLFSMQPNLADLKETFGWYFLAALPLTIIILVASRWVGGGLRWLRRRL